MESEKKLTLEKILSEEEIEILKKKWLELYENYYGLEVKVLNTDYSEREDK